MFVRVFVCVRGGVSIGYVSYNVWCEIAVCTRK